MNVWHIFIILPVVIVAGAFLVSVFTVSQSSKTLVKSLLFKNGEPIVIAHRAGEFEAPENTLIAIETAAKNGATAVEIDLEFSKDDVPILFHDENVDRMTNGTGPVRSLTYEELSRLNMAAKHNVIKERGKEDRVIQFAGIPKFTEAFELCMKLGLTIILDCKSDPGLTVKTLKDLLAIHPEAPNFILVTAFNPVTVYKARQVVPEYATGLIWRHSYCSRTISGVQRYGMVWTVVYDLFDKLAEWFVHSRFVNMLGVGALSLQKNHMSQNYVKFFRDNDFELLSWTVNHPLEKQYFREVLRLPIITDSVLDNPDCYEQIH